MRSLLHHLQQDILIPVTTALLSREQSLKRETLQAQLEELWRAAAEALLVQQGKAQPDPSCAEAALLLADRPSRAAGASAQKMKAA